MSATKVRTRTVGWKDSLKINWIHSAVKMHRRQLGGHTVWRAPPRLTARMCISQRVHAAVTNKHRKVTQHHKGSPRPLTKLETHQGLSRASSMHPSVLSLFHLTLRHLNLKVPTKISVLREMMKKLMKSAFNDLTWGWIMSIQPLVVLR